MSSPIFLAQNLAAAFCSGKWSRKALLKRAEHVVGGRRRGLRPLVTRLAKAFNEAPPVHAIDGLVEWIASDADFPYLCWNQWNDPVVRRLAWITPAMAPSPWPVPALPTVDRLAGWLGVTASELEWFADCH